MNEFTDEDKANMEYLINEEIEGIPQYSVKTESVEWKETLKKLLEKVRSMSNRKPHFEEDLYTEENYAILKDGKVMMPSEIVNELNQLNNDNIQLRSTIKEIHNLSFGCRDSENLRHILQIKLM